MGSISHIGIATTVVRPVVNENIAVIIVSFVVNDNAGARLNVSNCLKKTAHLQLNAAGMTLYLAQGKPYLSEG